MKEYTGTFGCDPETSERGPGGWIHLGAELPKGWTELKRLRCNKCYKTRISNDGRCFLCGSTNVEVVS